MNECKSLQFVHIHWKHHVMKNTEYYIQTFVPKVTNIITELLLLCIGVPFILNIYVVGVADFKAAELFTLAILRQCSYASYLVFIGITYYPTTSLSRDQQTAPTTPLCPFKKKHVALHVAWAGPEIAALFQSSLSIC